jgi:hypothetical protein
MLIPSELLVQERVQEHDREAEHMRLVQMVVPAETLVERLRRFGAELFGGENKPTQHKN